MKRLMGWCLIVALSTAIHPAFASAKMLDGFALETPSTLNRGAWNLKSYLEFGSGAKPLTANILTGGGSVTAKVNTIRLPVEIRYGLTENWEVGGDLGFESDDGTEVPSTQTASQNTVQLLSGSGLQRMRFYGKWNFWRDIAAMAEMAFLGSDELYYGSGGFDFGLKFIYGPQLGAGMLNLNLGFLFKSGTADLDGGKADIPSADESYGTVMSYGIGYIYPYSDRFTGIFEMAGGSSPFDGGGKAKTKSLLGFNLGGRYGFTDQFLLDGGLGIGIGDGSASFLLKVGMDWTWGAIEESASGEPAGRWTPSQQPREERPAPTPSPTPSTTTPPKQAEYYEPPTRYDMPKPPPPPPSGPTAEEQFQTRVADANTAFIRGDYVSAAAHYDAAVKIKDNDPVVHYNLATCYFQQKKYADARTYYKNAVTFNPNDVDSHLYLGYTHYYLQDQASAISEWQKVIQLDPSNTTARENLKSLGVE